MQARHEGGISSLGHCLLSCFVSHTLDLTLTTAHRILSNRGRNHLYGVPDLRTSRSNGREAGVTPHNLTVRLGVRIPQLSHRSHHGYHTSCGETHSPTVQPCPSIFDGSLLDVFHGPSTHPAPPSTTGRPSSLARSRRAPASSPATWLAGCSLSPTAQPGRLAPRARTLSGPRRCSPARGVPACTFETRGEMGGPGGRPSLGCAAHVWRWEQRGGREDGGREKDEAWWQGGCRMRNGNRWQISFLLPSFSLFAAARSSSPVLQHRWRPS